MRHIGTLSDAAQAQTFVDYILVRGVKAAAERDDDGWAVWVYDEDSVPLARQELEEFQRNPAEPRFVEAGRQAAEMRQEHERDRKSVV